MYALPWLLVLVAWGYSIWSSAGLPVGDARWLSSHTLQTMRGYEVWGLLPTLGANVVIPPGPETEGIALRALAKHEGAYLTYPSIWSLALYPFWLAARPFLAPETFLELAGLALVRLGGALALYALLAELGRILLPPDAPRWRAVVPALTVVLAWLTAGPVQFWSQYNVFADQLVLPACYAATAIALRARFRLAALTPGLKAGLAAATLLAWGTEWLGWVVMVVLTAGFAWRSAAELPGATPEARGLAFARAGWCLVVPAGLALAYYALQLSWYEQGWSQLAQSFLRRAASRETDEGVALPLGVIAGKLAHYGVRCLPLPVQAGAGALVNGLLGGGPLPAIALVPLAAAGLMGTGLVLAWRGAPDRRLAGLALAAVLLPPALHTGLLLQHATLHPFSNFKAALPLLLLLIGLPAWAVLQRRPARGTIAALLVALGLSGALVVRDARAQVASWVPPPSTFLTDLRVLVERHAGQDGLPLSDQFAFDTMRAHAVWRVGRLVYDKPQLAALAPKLRPEALERLTPVVFAYAARAERSRFAPLVAGRWRPVPERLAGEAVVVARLPELRGKLGAWLRDARRFPAPGSRATMARRR